MKTIINSFVFDNYKVKNHIIINEQKYLGTIMFKKIYKNKKFKIFHEIGNINRYTLINKRRQTYHLDFNTIYIYEIDYNDNIIENTRNNYNTWIEKYIKK